MTNVGAALAVLLAIATPAAAPGHKPRRVEPAYCPTDTAITMPRGMGANTRAYLPCSITDAVRHSTWRT